MACRRIDLPCLLAAGSGILLLLPVINLSVYPYIPAAVSLVSLAVGLHRLECRRIRVAVAALVGLSWVLTISYAETARSTVLYVAIAMQYAATAISLVEGGAGAGLPVFASSYTTMLVLFGDSVYAEKLLSMGYIVIGALIATLLSQKPHPLLALIASPVILVFGGEAAVMLSLVTYMAVLAGSGAIFWVGCPFKTDSGLVFAGTITGIIGAVLEIGSPTMRLGLYSAGLLLLLAGILTPSSPSHMRPSSSG